MCSAWEIPHCTTAMHLDYMLHPRRWHHILTGYYVQAGSSEASSTGFPIAPSSWNLHVIGLVDFVAICPLLHLLSCNMGPLFQHYVESYVSRINSQMCWLKLCKEERQTMTKICVKSNQDEITCLSKIEGIQLDYLPQRDLFLSLRDSAILHWAAAVAMSSSVTGCLSSWARA